MSTRKKFILNLISSYFLKITNLICSFILPRVILTSYGSEVNGLISSITQFLSVIYLTDMGINVVVQANLFKPLAEGDKKKLSEIIISSERFFRKIGFVLIIYSLILCFIYPLFSDTSFDAMYIAALVIILSINMLAQYMFGIVRIQLLSADQRGYVVSITSCLTMLANTIVCCILMYLGWGIHIVKLVTALFYTINPIVYYVYVKRSYDIDWKLKYKGEPIKQKWNAIAQHINTYVNSNTDVILLTWFGDVKYVSVYSVYLLVLKGISTVLSILHGSVQPVLGMYWAKNDKRKFTEVFEGYSTLLMGIGTIFYGCTLRLIVPFVLIYTKGINDISYDVPLFAIVITLAYSVDFFNSIYKMIVNTVGHFKQTQNIYIAASIINIFVSLICIAKYNLVGVAIGTLCSACIQLVWMGIYVYKKVISGNIKSFIIILLKNALSILIGFYVCSYISISTLGYIDWCKQAVFILLIWVVITFVIYAIVDFNGIKACTELVRTVLSRKKSK